MDLGLQLLRLEAWPLSKAGGPLSPFPGRASTSPFSGKLMKIPVIELKTSRGVQTGRGPILGKINYLGELFKNYLRGGLRTLFK